jgi:hypothetical protein
MRECSSSESILFNALLRTTCGQLSRFSNGAILFVAHKNSEGRLLIVT